MRWSSSCVAAALVSTIYVTFGPSHAIALACFQLPCRSERNVFLQPKRLGNPQLRHLRSLYSSSLRTTNVLDGERTKQNSFSERDPEIGRATPKTISHISSIRSWNLAGVKGGYDDCDEIFLNLEAHNEDGSNLVVVTGETGSGKSLLVSKVADLVTGGKATPSLLHTPKDTSVDPSASVEMVLKLYDGSHVSMVRNILERMGVDPSPMLGTGQAGVPVTLKLKRSLLLSDSSGRIKSACSINDQSVTLKILKSVGAPLLAIVNAPAAASALGRPGSRMAMLDTAVPSVVLTWVRQLQANYLKCRKAREKLEHELATRTLPISMNINGDDEKDLKLLRHWIDELDGFEGRISKVCQSIPSEGLDGGSSLAILMEEFDGLAWMDNDSDGMAFSSALYRRLFDLSDHLKLMDDKIEAALKARESLASLSMPDSARTALERTRDLLVDATAGEDWSPSAEEMNDSKLVTASERAHQLLNHVEDALTECANFLDDDEKGLVGILQSERNACKLSSEDIMAYTTEWSTLARKHGISPYLLPSCHASLRQELDGNVEARTLLPAAKKAETKALTSLEEGCQVLSQARSELAKRLSRSISRRLPLLGMENSRFETRLRTIGDPTYISGLGVDEVDFFLLHDTSKSTTTNSAQDDSFVGSNNNGESQSSSSQRGGKVDLVASSGEKARILLAIECEIPGSVRALCGITPGGSDGDDENTTPPPVAVIYDEIDAHVGGRASVSVAQMLSDQSRSCQVVSITHSPSVAAMADLHICIQRHAPSADGRIVASANLVEGSSRRKELARMAAGDMAPEEAEVFVEALIRDVRLKPEEWK